MKRCSQKLFKKLHKRVYLKACVPNVKKKFVRRLEKKLQKSKFWCQAKFVSTGQSMLKFLKFSNREFCESQRWTLNQMFLEIQGCLNSSIHFHFYDVSRQNFKFLKMRETLPQSLILKLFENMKHNNFFRPYFIRQLRVGSIKLFFWQEMLINLPVVVSLHWRCPFGVPALCIQFFNPNNTILLFQWIQNHIS